MGRGSTDSRRAASQPRPTKASNVQRGPSSASGSISMCHSYTESGHHAFRRSGCQLLAASLPFAPARSGLVGLVVNILLLRGFFAYDLGTPYGCHVAAHIDPGFLAAVFLVIDIGIGAIDLFFPVCVGVLGGVAMLM